MRLGSVVPALGALAPGATGLENWTAPILSRPHRHDRGSVSARAGVGPIFASWQAPPRAGLA